MKRKGGMQRKSSDSSIVKQVLALPLLALLLSRLPEHTTDIPRRHLLKPASPMEQATAGVAQHQPWEAAPPAEMVPRWLRAGGVSAATPSGSGLKTELHLVARGSTGCMKTLADVLTLTCPMQPSPRCWKLFEAIGHPQADQIPPGQMTPARRLTIFWKLYLMRLVL
jgi:hypothetical protein